MVAQTEELRKILWKLRRKYFNYQATDQDLDSFIREICQIFQPKTDESLLTDEEVLAIIGYIPIPGHDIRKIIKAQLAKVQKHTSRPGRDELKREIGEIHKSLVSWNMELNVPEKEKLNWRQAEERILALFPDEKELRKQIIKEVEELIIGGRLGKPEQEGKDVFFLDAERWQEVKENLMIWEGAK